MRNRWKSAALLQTLSHKDRRDVRTEVLMDFLLNTPDVSDSLYECYLPSVVCMDAPLNKITCVLSPRISTEELATPYRSFFCSKFTDAETDSFRINPHGLIEWVRQFVTINNETKFTAYSYLSGGCLAFAGGGYSFA